MFSLNIRIKSKIATHNIHYAIQSKWSALRVLCKWQLFENEISLEKVSIIIENPLRIFASPSTNNNKEAKIFKRNCIDSHR